MNVRSYYILMKSRALVLFPSLRYVVIGIDKNIIRCNAKYTLATLYKFACIRVQ